MPKLVERTVYSCLRTVMIPAFLHRLVAQWSSPPVLFRSEERPVFVAHAFQVGPELLHETRIVEQDRSPLATLPHNGQAFIVEREVKILHIQGKPLTDPQTGLRKQTEEESVTQMLGGNGFENAFNVGALHATRLRRIEYTRSILRIGFASSSSCCSAQVRKRATAACLRALVAGRRWACSSKNVRKMSAVIVCIGPW
jgi:hypothetical protein